MFDIFLLLIQHLIDTMTSQIDSCCLLIKSLDDLLIVSSPFLLNRCDSGNELSHAVSIYDFELEIIILNKS